MVGYGYMILVDAILTLVSIILGMLLRLDILYSGYSLFGYFLKQIGPFIIFAVFLQTFMALRKLAGFYQVGRIHFTWFDHPFIGNLACYLSTLDENISTIVINPGGDVQYILIGWMENNTQVL
jgi:hypothetical protein